MAPTKTTRKTPAKKSMQTIKGVKAAIKRSCETCARPTLLGYAPDSTAPFELTHELLECKCGPNSKITPKRQAIKTKVIKEKKHSLDLLRCHQ